MRKHALKLLSLLSVALMMTLVASQRATADDDDPPGRVARLSYTRGSVSLEPAGTEDWVTTTINRPITTGDKLWTDNGARAELNFGSAAVRLSGNTGFSFLNLDDRTVQIRLTEGTISLRVRNLDQHETLEIDTPNLAFSVLRPGQYKIAVNESGDATVVTVRGGEGEVTGGGSAYSVHPNQVATFTGTDQLSAELQRFAGDNDDFDSWCADRDRRFDRSQSVRYVSTNVIGYEDLDDYGSWRPVPDYGTVWFPNVSDVGWAPYRYGHWAWIAPWGWTWVDDAPWGFAPFHYGRWVDVRGAWGWVPCPPRPAVITVAYVRPVYAPALVVWVGGSHFAVGGGIGGGVNVGWFPLGPREVYVPSYHVSRTYMNNVNITNTTVNTTVVNNYYNTTVVNKNVNVANVRYVNQSAPGAVTAMSGQAFASAQNVHRNMVKVDATEIASAPVAVTTPAVAPQRSSVLGAGTAAQSLPPAALQSRAVVAKTPPPPEPISFAKQQQAIQANGGMPIAISRSRQLEPQNVPQERPNIKIAPPARTPPQEIQTRTSQPGQPSQPRQPQNNNAARPGQLPPSNNAARPDQPPAGNNANRPGQPQPNNNAARPGQLPPSNNAARPDQPPAGNNANRPGQPQPNNNAARPGQLPPSNNAARPDQPPASNNANRPGQPPANNNAARPDQPPASNNANRPGQPPADKKATRPDQPPAQQRHSSWPAAGRRITPTRPGQPPADKNATRPDQPPSSNNADPQVDQRKQQLDQEKQQQEPQKREKHPPSKPSKEKDKEDSPPADKP